MQGGGQQFGFGFRHQVMVPSPRLAAQRLRGFLEQRTAPSCVFSSPFLLGLHHLTLVLCVCSRKNARTGLKWWISMPRGSPLRFSHEGCRVGCRRCLGFGPLRNH